MIKLISTLLFLTIISAFALSAFAFDSVQDYLNRNTFPTRNSKFDGQLFVGEWNEKDLREPPGGYLFRFDAPLGSKGGLVYFVTSSLFVSMRESTWSAYNKDGNGNSILLSDEVEFAKLNFFLAPATLTRGPMLSEITSDKTSLFVKAFYLDNLGKWQAAFVGSVPRTFVKEDTDPSYSITEIKNLAESRHLGVPFRPKIEKILLAEYLKNPSSEWRVCKDSHIYGQQTDPTEKGHLDAAKNFHMEDAARLWNLEKPAAPPQK